MCDTVTRLDPPDDASEFYHPHVSEIVLSQAQVRNDVDPYTFFSEGVTLFLFSVPQESSLPFSPGTIRK